VNPLRAGLLLCALLVPGVVPAQAAEPRQEPAVAVASEPALAGHYYLQGVMETGSELMLGDDGQFQWYFSYGALDLLAKGRWHREGERVVLVPDDFRSPPDYSRLAFQRMQLRVDGKDLVPAWPWEDGAERGRYVAE
jgi:hypothetical protein